MSFNTLEKIRISQLLEIQYPATDPQELYIVESNMRAAIYIGGTFTQTTASKMWTWIAANVEGVDELETEVRRILGQYESIMNVTATSASMSNVGSVQGIIFNPDKQRALLRKQLQTIIPFYRHEDYARQGLADARTSIGVSITR